MLHRSVFAFFMSLVLSIIMSAWVTYLNLGLTSDFIAKWLEAWILAWPAAAVCAFLFGPGVGRLTNQIVNKAMS
ncbi:DUF2798 domain-containing protein [Salinimonas lutimaris]|uniref:DUF2798 domain-containing protein n=1 Tax=Salinimonas lutimaris TaxID=914153 RepID=UPI0010C0EE64|nr:DUF2798 domain-containing protein [Salinimonas lutimaris]